MKNIMEKVKWCIQVEIYMKDNGWIIKSMGLGYIYQINLAKNMKDTIIKVLDMGLVR